MTERIIDISETPARLSVDLDRLVVESGGQKTTVPLDQVGGLIVSCPGVTYTQAVLSGLLRGGGWFVCCDERHMPVGLLAPFAANTVQTERFALQAVLSVPKKKQLWAQVVRTKVAGQAKTLRAVIGDDNGLSALSGKVKSGDSGNIEALAARLYWPALFRTPDFRRDPDAEGVNGLLNYAYAILRAGMARAICGAGLHPSLGLHHHNRYDAYCLASDLMEPFRPLADRVVADLTRERGMDAALDAKIKRLLLGALTSRHRVAGERRTIFDLMGGLASSLAEVVMGRRSGLRLPDVDYEAEQES
ncbi:type II CRISPR-associated endonuclease Cas1 [Desulfovibrio aminophilus]|uniref:type II CRISPR-associated endonuclease Cas1 n=1 Tax=Desulfovibrio aminophilus TaxID=81425 RepID=UPI0033922600